MRSGVLERWLTPRAALMVVVLLMLAIIALGPRLDGRDGSSQLTTYSSGPSGTRGLWQLLHQLGWRTGRRVVPLTGPLDTAAVYAVLAPPLPLTTNEVHTLLDAVRRGAGAIVVPRASTPLADSLHLEQSPASFIPYIIVDSTTPDADAADSSGDDADAMARASNGALTALWYYFRQTAPLPAGTVTFLAVHDREHQARPAVLGMPLGRGRLVAVADPRIFRNALVRQGDAAVLDTRLVEWLTTSPHSAVVFDEYHNGFGDHGSLRRALEHAMLGTPAGRMLTQAIVAGLALLLVLGARAVPPSPRTRVERREPMEHVGALARAYEEIGATRTAARRLLRGLRRRHPFGGRAAADDDSFLDAVENRHPVLANDIALIRRALRQPLAPQEFLGVGRAIHNMERTMVS